MSVLIPNTHQTPNAYVDDYMCYLTNTELRVLWFAIRHIYGWQDRIAERQGVISLEMFVSGFTTKAGKRFNGCGLQRQAVIAALKSLEQFGFIARVGKATRDGQRWEMKQDGIDLAGLQQRQAAGQETDRKRTTNARQKRASGMSDNTSNVGHTSTSNVGHTASGNVPHTESNSSPNPSSKPTHAPSGAAAAKAEKPNTKGKEKSASAKAVSKWTLRECAAFEERCSAALAALRAAFGHDTDMSTFASMTVLEQRAFIGVYQELERVGVASTDYAALVKFARVDWPKLPVSQLPKYVTDWRQASKPKAARKYAGEATTEPKTSKPEETPEERAQRLAQFRAMRPASIGGAS